jgi:hypothetical protein
MVYSFINKLLSLKKQEKKSFEKWYDEILYQWDTCYVRGNFPQFASHETWIFARTRLSTYRSHEEWLTIFELLTYYNGLVDVDIIVFAFGNKLSLPGLQFVKSNQHKDDFINSLKNSGLRVPYNATNDEEWCPDPLNFDILLNQTYRHFSPTTEDYLRAGIDLTSPISGDKCLDDIVRVIRLLSYQLPDNEIFYSDTTLLNYVGRPTDLPLFLRLSEWCHPGLGDTTKPSESPCLRNLARALSDNQPDLYHCPKQLVNTHWSRWPQFVHK